MLPVRIKAERKDKYLPEELPGADSDNTRTMIVVCVDLRIELLAIDHVSHDGCEISEIDRTARLEVYKITAAEAFPVSIIECSPAYCACRLSF